MKIFAAAALSAVIFFGLGMYFGRSRPATAAPYVPETPGAEQTIAALRASNQHLQTEAARLKADILRLSEANAEVATRRGQPQAGK